MAYEKRYISVQEWNDMSDEELWEISMQKNKRGIATADALKAQGMILERSGGNGHRHTFQGFSEGRER